MIYRQYKLQKFFSRKTAEDGINLNEFMLLAGDKNVITSHKYFLKIPITEIDEILPDLLSRNTNLYEILPPNLPVKPYFDLELEREGLTTEDCYDKLHLFINCV